MKFKIKLSVVDFVSNFNYLLTIGTLYTYYVMYIYIMEINIPLKTKYQYKDCEFFLNKIDSEIKTSKKKIVY